MDQNNLSLDLLLQETLALSEYLRTSSTAKNNSPKMPMVEPVAQYEQRDFLDHINSPVQEVQLVSENLEIQEELSQIKTEKEITDLNTQALAPVESTVQLPIISSTIEVEYPESAGIIYKIDSGVSTFCVRGFTTSNIKQEFSNLQKSEDKKGVLKLNDEADFSEVCFFETRSLELAEAVKEQIINRRFPHQEDAVCNISDPGFSWWMDVSQNGRFEIFFKAHSINRAEKSIQLGPIGDGAVAALRMNQARNLLRSSFPISEYSCDEKSFTVASQKPDHLSFVSFMNIFLRGENNTQAENFPDNSVGRALYYYFHELAIVRKFWIEVKTKLG